jgi:hypothetical protein
VLHHAVAAPGRRSHRCRLSCCFCTVE